MKKAHKAFVTEATEIRRDIKAEILKAADLELEIQSSKTRIREMESVLSEVEAEAAASGLSSVDLRAAVDKVLS